MAKKIKVKKSEKNKKRIGLRNPWFKRHKGFFANGYTPITWQGYLFLILFLALNFYSVFYFKIPFGNFDEYIKFFVVLLLSIFVFLIVAKKKTVGEEKEF